MPEIESCSSGGARVDLGILEHADRIWASDCIDPLERLGIMRWTTTQLIPPGTDRFPSWQRALAPHRALA